MRGRITRVPAQPARSLPELLKDVICKQNGPASGFSWTDNAGRQRPCNLTNMPDNVFHSKKARDEQRNGMEATAANNTAESATFAQQGDQGVRSHWKPKRMGYTGWLTGKQLGSCCIGEWVVASISNLQAPSVRGREPSAGLPGQSLSHSSGQTEGCHARVGCQRCMNRSALTKVYFHKAV